ncbi:CBS domain-containing protein [Streptomyces sp. NBC_01092]|uniref:CBS domain-containing protein n=1 Tax=Streptomyces sp. NBC_01092 TaxID=2903748 RepID=UPI003868BAA2|nr:CBS domain-containing protein [Streptomyces sp. NBC_01092]
MSARDLAEPYPSVSTDDDATEAARLLAEYKLPALLVVDPDGQPYAIVPGSQLIGQLVPEYALEDPLLGAVIDDRDLDDVREKLTGLTVAEWLPRRRFLPPTVGPDASVMHIAALMARTHTPLVAVVESDGDQTRLAGAVSAARLMEQLVGGP